MPKPTQKDYRDYHAAIRNEAKLLDPEYKNAYHDLMSRKGVKGQSVGKTRGLARLCKAWCVAKVLSSL